MLQQKVLTAGQLNRATLDRQLLLRRKQLEVVDGVRWVAALQAQSPASPFPDTVRRCLWRVPTGEPGRSDTGVARNAQDSADLLDRSFASTAVSRPQGPLLRGTVVHLDFVGEGDDGVAAVKARPKTNG